MAQFICLKAFSGYLRRCYQLLLSCLATSKMAALASWSVRGSHLLSIQRFRPLVTDE